jgi:hypothetical protein
LTIGGKKGEGCQSGKRGFSIKGKADINHQSGELEAFLGKNTLFEKKLSFETMATREVTFF